jgi:glyoxylate/hydroxypyruvate reductase A
LRVAFWCPWSNADVWLARLRTAGPELEFVEWPGAGDPAAIEAAVVWRPPAELFESLSSLRCICVLGAGVDHLFALGDAVPQVPVIRLVDPLMAERMASYVLAVVLCHQRQLDLYRRQQEAQVWRRHAHRDIGATRVGIMGLGAMGRATALLLARVGYDVAGWSRSARSIEGIRCMAGAEEWHPFLARSDVLVCLLPLTASTRGILDREVFDRLPEGALLINAARGEHLVESDLIAVLDAGRLGGAVLDVFAEEPLPPEHVFWRHPKVTVTPHVASLSEPDSGAARMVEALRAVRAGRTPAHLVERADYPA